VIKNEVIAGRGFESRTKILTAINWKPVIPVLCVKTGKGM
jgi:hypothetical protein